ncbi:imelysin family protein [Marinobacterium sediminicola]|uniref:Imelysin-like domain-containing protein n=1 Tax=Marinobacterium sediminicola TaxID=518898 RepID=A0ABY1S2W7_9GAMM|nr:imelysin family protein [Marinobacterium sediminicola]ULG69258.1 imelysin family protein [Marinobacterium sediminicola]SMR77607.1 hypothetical protein SAMN04487964_11521 [Marinobacterium sediminicola]
MQSTHTRMWPVWLAATALVLLAGLAHASPQEPDWPHFNHQLVQQHLLPRYAQLDSTATALSQASATLCRAPNQQALQTAREAWFDSMQAWQGIQHVQFGPVQFLMRNFSLEFWPDRKNIGARQLRQTLASDLPYDDEFFRHASVSIQGFPALERLLFDDNALQHLQQGRSCELTTAIAAHIAQISQAIHQEWQTKALNEFSPKQDTDTAADLAVELMASLVEPIEVIRDSKLLKPMADSTQTAKPKLLESHRSGSSLANIRSNLAALNELYQGTDASVDQLLQQADAAELARDIRLSFTNLDRALSQISSPLKIAVAQPEAHVQLVKISTQLKQLNDQLHSAMDVLGIQLGFNSRDGD